MTRRAIDPEDFVQQFAQAWAARDPDLLGALFHPDAVVRQPPVRRSFTGREVPTYFRAVFELVPDLLLVPTDWAARGDTVMIEWTINASVGDGQLTWSGCDRFRLDDGVIVDEAVYFDSQPLWEALDASMRRDRGLIELGREGPVARTGSR